jgi:hypothetical protein
LEINDEENPRLLLWPSALEQFNLSPIWGTGGFSFLYYGRIFRDPRIQGDLIHVHNDYLQLLADYGVVGVSLFAVLLLCHLGAGMGSFRWLLRSAKQSGTPPGDRLALLIGCLSVVAAYIVHSMIDFNMQISLNALVIACVFGMLAHPGCREGEANPTRANWFPIALRWMLLPMGMALLWYAIPMIPGEYAAERSRFLIREGHDHEALELALQKLQTVRDNPELYYYAGEAATRVAAEASTQDSSALRFQAVSMFGKGLQLFPTDSRLTLKLGMAKALSGDYYGALAAVDRAKELDPKSSFVPAYRGFVEYTFLHFDDADSNFSEAIELGGEGGEIAKRGMEFTEKARLAPPEAASQWDGLVR